MNDDEVLTMVGDGFTSVRMTATADAVMAQGRSLRRRRRTGRLATGAALALALGAGLSVPALTSGSSGGAQRPTLAAWTVQQAPDGSIAVTIRELRDLAALQARLNADGARVTVGITTLTLPKGCVLSSPIPLGPGLFRSESGQKSHEYVFVIRASGIPRRQLLRIVFAPGPRPANPPVTAKKGPVFAHGQYIHEKGAPAVFLTLVKDTPQCAS
jgi:hypothetical protein